MNINKNHHPKHQQRHSQGWLKYVCNADISQVQVQTVISHAAPVPSDLPCCCCCSCSCSLEFFGIIKKGEQEEMNRALPAARHESATRLDVAIPFRFLISPPNISPYTSY